MPGKRISLKDLLPKDWREAVVILRRLRVVESARLIRISCLVLVQQVTEAFGLFLILPILQFAENNGNIEALQAQTQLWRYLVMAHEMVHLNVTLFSLSGAAFVLIMIRQVTSYVSALELVRLREGVARRMRQRAFVAVMRARGGFIQAMGSGTFVHLMQVLAPNAAVVLSNLISSFTVLFTLVLYGGGLLVVSPVATLTTVVLAVVLGQWLKRYRLRSRALGGQLVGEFEHFVQLVSERYHGWRLIKLSGRLEDDAARINDHAGRIAQINIEVTRAGEKIQLTIAPVAAAAALGGMCIAFDYLHLAVSEITVFVVILLRLMPLVQATMSSRQRLAASFGYLTRGAQLMTEAQAAAEISSGSRTFAGVAQSVRFENVHFTYPGADHPALNGLDAVIPAGRMTAVVGPSGAGKSTLVDLMPGLVRPTSGRIVADGIDLAEFSLESLRAGMVFVPQQPLLFGASIAENLRYSRPDATVEEMVEACRKAYAHDFIEALPNGYETVIGEGGATLSGGQRQRLVLARAFLSSASLLILDEPTSALDYQSERCIQQALDEIVRSGKTTVVIIAHRLSTIRDADHVIVMDRGRVVDQGRPADLQHEDGWYAQMLKPTDAVSSSQEG